MKHVIKSPPLPQYEKVLLGDTNVHNYYGVIIAKNQRGFITRQRFPTTSDSQFTNYEVRALDRLTKANGWNNLIGVTLQECIKCCIDKDYEVFEFDNYQSLIEWLLEA